MSKSETTLMRRFRAHHGLALLRLKVYIKGAPFAPKALAGDTVTARWNDGATNIARGWVIQDIGMLCVLNEPDVEVIERP